MYEHSQPVTYTESSAELQRSVITDTHYIHSSIAAALPFPHVAYIPTYFHRHPSVFKCFIYDINKKQMRSTLVNPDLQRSIITIYYKRSIIILSRVFRRLLRLVFFDSLAV